MLEVGRGSITPLIIGANGGIGEECQKCVKQLVELLAIKQMECYASTVSWIMTKLAIEVIRSAVLGVKGGQGHRGRGPPLLRRMILAYLLIMQG